MTKRSYAALDFLAKGLHFCQHLTDDSRVTDNADVMWFKGICYGLRGNIPNTESGERARTKIDNPDRAKVPVRF